MPGDVLGDDFPLPVPNPDPGTTGNRSVQVVPAEGAQSVMVDVLSPVMEAEDLSNQRLDRHAGRGLDGWIDRVGHDRFRAMRKRHPFLGAGVIPLYAVR